ncbi:dolichol phosphate-mannose biosynthesis regulatory [Lipomyces oligophaga]|uniref:dolichol phosphate-mannose biosynthesis regulatory n=1 Tax=Lipomyces oligophaga TaxID=45792 RepID=UPI0034CDE849
MGILFFMSTLLFIYYTIWALVMPFVDSTQPVQKYFPPREWAIKVPVIILLLIMGMLGSFLGVVMIRSNRPLTTKSF